MDAQDTSRPAGTSGTFTDLAVKAAPGVKAGSRISRRSVAAITMTPSLLPKPSISTRSWLSVCSRSSWLCPYFLGTAAAADASISSMKITAGHCAWPAQTGRENAARADADIQLHKIRTENGKELHICLTGHSAGQQRLARARRPTSSTPLGMRAPMRRYFLRDRAGNRRSPAARLFLVRSGDVAEHHLVRGCRPRGHWRGRTSSCRCCA